VNLTRASPDCGNRYGGAGIIEGWGWVETRGLEKAQSGTASMVSAMQSTGTNPGQKGRIGTRRWVRVGMWELPFLAAAHYTAALPLRNLLSMPRVDSA
jgi:hypothetical protein